MQGHICTVREHLHPYRQYLLHVPPPAPQSTPFFIFCCLGAPKTVALSGRIVFIFLYTSALLHCGQQHAMHPVSHSFSVPPVALFMAWRALNVRGQAQMNH